MSVGSKISYGAWVDSTTSRTKSEPKSVLKHAVATSSKSIENLFFLNSLLSVQKFAHKTMEYFFHNENYKKNCACPTKSRTSSLCLVIRTVSHLNMSKLDLRVSSEFLVSFEILRVLRSELSVFLFHYRACGEAFSWNNRGQPNIYSVGLPCSTFLSYELCTVCRCCSARVGWTTCTCSLKKMHQLKLVKSLCDLQVSKLSCACMPWRMFFF